MISGETWESEPDCIVLESIAEELAFKSPEIRMRVKDKLQPLHGDYLTMTLYLKHAARLTGILTPAAIEQSLNKCPMNRDQIYYDSLCSIEKSSPEISGWSFQVLSWVLNVCRPLTVQELSMAIAISQAKEDFSKEIITKNIPVQMWETCDRYLGLFLQVEGDTVHLVHETAKSSILAFAADTKRKNITFLDNSDIAILCLKYLLLHLPIVDKWGRDNEGLRSLLSYAARYWPAHYLLGRRQPLAEKADLNFLDQESLIGELLGSQDLREKWYRLFSENTQLLPAPTQLEIAAQLGLCHMVERILKKDSLEEELNLQRPLKLAIAHGHQDILDLLIQKGASVSSALPAAAKRNDTKLLSHLLDIKSEPEYKLDLPDLVKALNAAAKNGNLESLQLILAYAKEIEGFNLLESLPLEEAAKSGHDKMLSHILHYFTCPNSTADTVHDISDMVEKKVRDAFVGACKQGEEMSASILLKSNFTVNREDLSVAVEAGSLSLVNSILQKAKSQASDGTVDSLHDSNALLVAAEKGHIGIIELLRHEGFPVDVKSENGDTVLHKAALQGNLELTKYLIREAADGNVEINVPNHDNMTPGQFAAKEGHLLLFKTLQKSPQDASYGDIISAAENGQLLMVRYLLGLVRMQTDGGNVQLERALATAASRGHLSVIRALHQEGVEVNCQTGVHSALHLAASNGHIQVVEYLISEGADPNATGQFRRTPLHESVAHPEIMERLLDKKADFEATDMEDRTPLHYAVASKYTMDTDKLETSIEILLKAGANANAKDESNNTPLHIAAELLFRRAASLLLKYSAQSTLMNKSKATALHIAVGYCDLALVQVILESSKDSCELSDSDGETPLHIAVRGGDMPILRLVLDANRQVVNCKDENGKTPFGYAADRGDTDILSVLFDAGADINSADANQRTALYRASRDGRLSTVKLLVEKGANILLADESGFTPLNIAAFFGELEVVDFLLEKGEGLLAPDDEGCTPLHSAAMGGYLEVVRHLVGKLTDADLSTLDKDGCTPVNAAAANGHLDVVKFLIENGALPDISVLDGLGWTPLGNASANGHLAVVELLVENGANISILDNEGWTPLNAASANGHLDIIKFLIENGALSDISVPNNFGWLPLSVAAGNGHLAVVKLLIDNRASVLSLSNDEWTPINIASGNGHFEVVKLLFENNADISVPNKLGDTPLNNASTNGHIEIVRFLVESRADILRPNSNGKTPLNIASAGGHLEVVKFLFERGADISAADNMGRKPLHRASANGHEQVVKYLLQANLSDLDAVDLCGRTSLFHASARGHVSLVQFLHSCGSSLKIKDRYGATPVFAAVRNGQKESAQFLFDRSDEFIFKDDLGRSLTWWATQRGYTELVEIVHQYAKEAHIDITEEEEQVDPSSRSPPSELHSRWCDVCMRFLLSESAPYHSCKICVDFDICEDCFGIGAKCLDDSHEWTFNQPDTNGSD